MTTAKIFKSNQSQAVRLPKAVALPESIKEVKVIVMGQSRLLVPVNNTWDDFFLSSEGVSDDFMTERGDQEQQEREPF